MCRILGPLAYAMFHTKWLTKVITNRLNLVLNDFISKTQLAFVGGLVVTDNVIMSHVCIS